MAELEFDEAVAAQLDAVYRTRDILRRRAIALEALGAQPGETVVDVGCGPGYYVADLLQMVGEQGRVIGADPAPPMLAMTERRAGGHRAVRVVQASANELPLDDACADRALSVQVFEYLADVPGGLTELHRVVRPGGRVVLWDVDWTTLSWFARDRERMDRICRAWDRHLVDPALPQTLGASLSAAGFTDVTCEGHLFLTRAMDPEAFGGYLPLLIETYVQNLGEDALTADAADWVAELRDLDAAGEYFFSVTQFCFSATRR